MKKFGRWTVLSFSHNDKHRKPVMNCRCDCGVEKKIVLYELNRGRSKSCGCLQREAVGARSVKHGLGRHPLYHVWHKMIVRCSKKTDPAYPNYGGRGIFVCERWRDPSAFLADMGARPPGGSLDRIDNNGPYSPENCRWATRKEQARNTRSNRIVKIDGVSKTLAEWSEVYGQNYKTVCTRISTGVSVVEALMRPRATGRRLTTS